MDSPILRKKSQTFGFEGLVSGLRIEGESGI
jgi:hypothetical protein